MATVLLVLVVVLVVAGLVYVVVSLLTGEDPALVAVEPDGRALPLPNNRSLTEADLKAVKFDLALRGYRMAQVDRVLRRTAYDLGYKDEMIAVLEAEVIALREGRLEDAELLRKAREAAASPPGTASPATVKPATGPATGEPASPALEEEPAEDEGPVDDEGPAAGGGDAEPQDQLDLAGERLGTGAGWPGDQVAGRNVTPDETRDTARHPAASTGVGTTESVPEADLPGEGGWTGGEEADEVLKASDRGGTAPAGGHGRG